MGAAEHIRQMVSQLEQLTGKVEALMLRGKFTEAVEELQECLRKGVDGLCAEVLEQVLTNGDFRRRLRVLGGRLGYRFESNQELTVILPGGTRKRLRSPYFTKASSKRRRRRKRKRGPNGTGRHLALEVFGFVDRVAPNLAFRAMQLAALCPSFEVASLVLNAEHLDLSPEKLRRLCGVFDALDPVERVEMSVETDETVAGKRVALSVDGGRCRTRRNKPGPIPAGRKRHGFHTDWKEPKLFTLTVFDDDGQVVKEIGTQVDGTFGGYQRFLDLLRVYLPRIRIDQAREVVLLADGAPWIWRHLPPLLAELGVSRDRLTETLDWTHAVQNLGDLKQFLRSRSPRQWKRLEAELRELLYQGELELLFARLKEEVRPSRADQMARKFRHYFEENRHRLQYAACVGSQQPIGSGVVESAIRRVNNLRLKAPGSFWLEAKAETMLFLRAKLLYGRWHLLVSYWTKRLHEDFPAPEDQQLDLAA